MSDGAWMFGLPIEAIDRIYAQRRERKLREDIDERLDRLEARIDALIEAMGAAMPCEKDPESSNKKC